jgi:hypothetical protein
MISIALDERERLSCQPCDAAGNRREQAVHAWLPTKLPL